MVDSARDGGRAAGAPAGFAAALPGLLPAAALALAAFAVGTFHGAASAPGAAAVHAGLLLAALAAAPAWRQPLALGRRGRFLTAAIVVAAVASCLASPVERAGWTVVLLLPAWLLVPAAVGRAWRRRRLRRLGVPAVSAVVLAVSAAALVGRFGVGDARASMPLGHHNLVAVWLVALLPLAVLPGRRGGPGRLLAAVSGTTALAALIATGSLSGAVGLVVLCLAAAVALACGRRRRRGALALVALALTAVALAVPRLVLLVGGDDPSVAARRTYWDAGLRGFLERPLLGWGPGSVPWTSAHWLRPEPGVNPPHQVLGDLHSLPLQILYELGLTGTLPILALLVLFAWRRLVALPGAKGRGGDPHLVAAGLLGLAGAAAACLAVAPLAVPAVGLALAVAAGAALAGEGQEAQPESGGPGTSEPRHRSWLLRGTGSGGGLPVLVYALLAAAVLVRLDLAHLHWDRARQPGAAAVRELARAVRWDPRFPLYRLHLALETEPLAAGPQLHLARTEAAAEALRAAEQGEAVAALWLAAGELAFHAGTGWADLALERACVLDPLGAAAPWRLSELVPGPARLDLAARALLAEPRLAAAVRFDADPSLRTAAVERAAGQPGLAPGWGSGLRRQVAAWNDAGSGSAIGAGTGARLRVAADRTADDSLSLYAFRRLPRPVDLASIPVDADRAAALRLPSAAVLPGTAARVFAPAGCRPAGTGGG